MAVVMVIEFDDHESEIDCLIVDVDDDCRRHCQMTSIESVDENVDVNESAIAILIEIAIEIDDDVVMVSVRIDVMMTMSMLTMMMMMMMMMVVTARRKPAVVPSSRHLATRECPRSGCVPTRQR